MPKPVKKRRKSRSKRDVNLWARDLVAQSTAEQEETTAISPAALSAYMAKLGAKGGKISGAKRMEMPVDQRKAIALIAARARWKKRPKS